MTDSVKIALAKTIADIKYERKSTYPHEPDTFVEGFVAGMKFLERVAEEEGRGSAEAEATDRSVKLLGNSNKEEPVETPIITKSHPGTPMLLGSRDELTMDAIPDELTLDAIPEDKYGNVAGCVTFKMKKRWLPAFIGMLQGMERNGNIGHSGYVSIFADGDGDFRPEFRTYANNKPVNIEPQKPKMCSVNTNLYDAG